MAKTRKIKQRGGMGISRRRGSATKPTTQPPPPPPAQQSIWQRAGRWTRNRFRNAGQWARNRIRLVGVGLIALAVTAREWWGWANDNPGIATRLFHFAVHRARNINWNQILRTNWNPTLLWAWMLNNRPLTLTIIGLSFAAPAGVYYIFLHNNLEQVANYSTENKEIDKLILKWTQPKNKNKIIECCMGYGEVQSRYFYNVISIDRAVYYFSLDTNHDFKFYSEPTWERNCFNNNPCKNQSIIVNDSNLAQNIADFFGRKVIQDFKTYICLDAVSINNDNSELGKFNTPIRWWDGGADSEVMTIIDAPNVNIEKRTNLPKNSDCLTTCSKCLFGCFNKTCSQCLKFVSSKIFPDKSPEEDKTVYNDESIHVEYIPPSPTRKSSVTLTSQSIPTGGSLASALGKRDLNWKVQNKFMNIHDFKLPLLHYNPQDQSKNFTYDLVLNLDNNNNFTLKMIYYNTNQIEQFSKTISLNRIDTHVPSVNCVSLTQVINMYKAITECYDNFPKKDTIIIPLQEYNNALKKSFPSVKSDYWNIITDIDNIIDFFEQIIEQYDYDTTGLKNYHTQMLLIFFFFNLKRSGDIGQIEAVKLLQKSYTNKEFVYFTLDSFAATIARDVYDVNVGLLSADKKSYTLCKRSGWKNGEVEVAEAVTNRRNSIAARQESQEQRIERMAAKREAAQDLGAQYVAAYS